VFASGSRFIEEHFEHGTSRAGPLYMMEKVGTDWRYTAVGPRGELVKEGLLPACEGCHAEAPDDHVFRVGDESPSNLPGPSTAGQAR
jgi:hypothetical protein